MLQINVLVIRKPLVWDQVVAGSNPVFPTQVPKGNPVKGCLFLCLKSIIPKADFITCRKLSEPS